MRQTPDEPSPLLIAALREGTAHVEALLTLARTEIDGNIRRSYRWSPSSARSRCS